MGLGRDKKMDNKLPYNSYDDQQTEPFAVDLNFKLKRFGNYSLNQPINI